jgi:hypothetical protein
MPSPTFASTFLSAALVADIALARYTEDRTLLLSTYSEDSACSSVVYARIDNAICTGTSVCTVHHDDDGSFHDTEMAACILDRAAYLKAAFQGSPYLTVELYPKDCLGKSYNTRTFLADGECHPYANSHFKVVHHHNGTTAVWSAESGCDASDWNVQWSVVSATDLNTEACITDGVDSWKSYLVEESSEDSTDATVISVSNPAATDAPTTTPAAPATNSTVLASSASSSLMPLGPSIVLLLLSVVLYAASVAL